MTKPDTYSKEFVPAHAVTCWVDDQFVYTAIPAKSGPPLIQRYALTEGGLTKALTVLKVQQRQKVGSSRYQIAVQATIRRDFNKRDGFSESQREKTRMVLRKMGII